MNTFEAFAGLAAGRVLNALPLGLLIALLAWTTQHCLGKDSSSIRFSVWFAALLWIFALPFLPNFRATSLASAAPVHAGIALPNSWAVAILVCWGVFALIGTIDLIVGLGKLHRLHRNCVHINVSGLPASLRETVQECNVIRRVAICISPDVRVPTAVGFFHPAILFPEWAWTELSEEDLRAIILHEFAHLERRDDWTNLVQKIIGALLLFHPAIWWIERRLSMEREVACDELVLAKTGNPQAYARCLISLAEKGFVRRSLAMAQSAVSHARDLSARIARILSSHRAIPNRVFKPTLSLAAIGAVIFAAVVAGAPELVTFEHPAQRSMVAASSTAEIAAAHVIPAKIKVDVQIPTRPRVVATRLAAERNEHSPMPTSARKGTQPTNSRLANASARDVTPSSQFLVLTQTTRFNEFGDVRVGFVLWRVTLPSGKEKMPQAEVIARSL